MILFLSLLTSGSLVSFFFCLIKWIKYSFKRKKVQKKKHLSKEEVVVLINKNKKISKIYLKAMLVCLCLLCLGITLFFAVGF